MLIIPIVFITGIDTFNVIFCITLELMTGVLSFFLWREVREHNRNTREYERQYNAYINRKK